MECRWEDLIHINIMKRIYCDISATTPLEPRIGDFMRDLNLNAYGNPSSIHREGQAAKAVVEKSRRQLATALSCTPDEIIFTSSGSESNNMVLKGVLKSGDHFITSSYEHPAIGKILPVLEQQGVEISQVQPDGNGRISPSSVEGQIRENTRLISIMWVNNELGTINPVSEIGAIARERKILFHSDGVQAFGKIRVNLSEIPVDFLSMSAHKLYGPKGVGALYKRQGAALAPLIHGGGQESNLRASTENVSGIGGFGMAAQLAADKLEENIEQISNLEASFLSLLDEKAINYKVNGKDTVPGVLNLTFPEMDGQSLVLQLDLAGIGISFGAACASGTMKASKMLLDLGLTKEDALSTVRISFGKIHNHEEMQAVAETLADILKKSISVLEEHEG